MTNGRSSILVVDDHPVILAGLREFLSGNRRIHYAGSVEAALISLLHESFSIALLDFYIGDDTCLPLCEELAHRHPSTRICVLTSHISPYVVSALSSIRPHAILDKATPNTDILQAIENMENDVRSYSPSATMACFEAILQPCVMPFDLAYHMLPELERNILRMSSEGRTASHIAQECGCTIATVHSVRRDLKKRFEAASMNELIAMYHRTQMSR